MALTTTKYALRYPELSDEADVPEWMFNLASDIDTHMVGYVQNVFASRPAAGVQGRRFWATDTKTEYVDDGSVWNVVGAGSRIGVYASRPAANTVAIGTKYFATDQVAEYVSDGSSWSRVGMPAGSVALCLASAADTGWLLLQGQSWPGTTGIYADIYARYGSPGTVPDFGGVVPAGYKSGDDHFGTLLAAVGAKTHTLIVSEMPSHDHGGATGGILGGLTVDTAPGSAYPYGSGVNSSALSAAHTHSIAAQGGGGAHDNVQPSKVINYQAKL